MTKRYIPLALPAAAALLLAGCIDENYDLSDIDTTSQISVKDLVLPVNIGELTLNQIIEVEENENIVKEPYSGPIAELQGKEIYVFKYAGDFESDKIHINAFHVNAPTGMKPSDVKVDLLPGVTLPDISIPGIQIDPIDYEVKYANTTFSYHIEGIDNKVKSVTQIQTPKVTFETEISLPASLKENMRIHIETLNATFPAGLFEADGITSADCLVDNKKGIATYDAHTGNVVINNYNLTGNGIKLTIDAQALDTELAKIQLNNGAFDYNGSIAVTGGHIKITPVSSTLPPTSFTMKTSYQLSSFDINKFSGEIDYQLDEISFDNVKLNDLPDFLTDPKTDINIANPQLYLSLSNSCAQYGLGGKTGLSVTPYRDGIPSETLSMDELIEIKASEGTGPVAFAISPEGTELNPIPAYSNAKKLKFSDFGKVLSGNGIPQEIAVDFTGAMVDGEADKFPLLLPGQDPDKFGIDAITGKYEFRAPLALANGSKIYYSGTEEDWDSEELQDLHISYLQLTADATSELPVDVDFSARLVNSNGDKIGECAPTKLIGGAQNQPITILIKPAEGMKDLTDVNGIFYQVEIVSNESSSTEPSQVPSLSPQQTIKLNNLKAKIDGYYLYKDEKFEENYPDK